MYLYHKLFGGNTNFKKVRTYKVISRLTLLYSMGILLGDLQPQNSMLQMGENDSQNVMDPYETR